MGNGTLRPYLREVFSDGEEKNWGLEKAKVDADRLAEKMLEEFYHAENTVAAIGNWISLASTKTE